MRGLSSPHVQNSVKSFKVDRSHKCVVLTYDLKDSSRGLLNTVTSVIKEQHLSSVICVKHNGKQLFLTTKLRSNTRSATLLDQITRLRSHLEPMINLTVKDYREPADSPQYRATSKRRDRNTQRRRRFVASQAHRPALVTS